MKMANFMTSLTDISFQKNASTKPAHDISTYDKFSETFKVEGESKTLPKTEENLFLLVPVRVNEGVSK
jgi:hypothetical protein